MTHRDYAHESRLDRAAAERYRRACVGTNVSVALSLLAFWDRPWSSNAQRFAYHALRHAQSRGINVLEATP